MGRVHHHHLLEKELGTRDPAKFRPITVTGCLIRLYHRIMARRCDSIIPISQMQRGFRPGDGLGFNISLLQAIVKERANPVFPEPLAMCFMDMRKAFDSVSHHTIRNVLQSAGAPPPFVEYIGNLYSEFQTQIAVNRRVSSPINVNRGVKQGDPLSCFLFNLVVDRCLRKLDPLLGIELSSDVRVTHLAFADDIVLLSEKPALLQRLVNQFTAEASSVGLEANAEKCASMDIRVHKRKVGRRWVVHPRPSVRILGHDIRPLSAAGAYKYLGVNVTARRRDDVAQQRKCCWEQLKAGLS